MAQSDAGRQAASPRQKAAHDAGRPVRFPATDGYPLGGFVWRAEAGKTGAEKRPVVVITSATSVRCRYYARFAAYLFEHGFDVLTYDYRGIDQSRPARLRGFAADWADWGEKDCEGALRFAAEHFGPRPISIVAHSIGGFAFGLAPSAQGVTRIFTVGAQYAHWRDYAARPKYRMLWKYHVVMPLMTAVFGYFPARRLGWMEDTPAGVARDWSRMRARFEDTIRPGRRIDGHREADLLKEHMAGITAPILAVSLSDDPHGTIPAVERLLAYFTGSERSHLHLHPGDIGHAAIGHFAFFHDRFRDTLWPLALAWLRDGTVPEAFRHRLL
ncbi:alpha/beta fold hydrolase [Rhizobium sp. CSW-27]|uniref:alpha/beta hydrolase family protein n=1 Tax=Rhizobium sp. CSW-27 TaxID=2839985 RepID=UPI001C016FEA|nr:alpha/beta fold hydrolase [Rhizobium sp. CSW-27]MBT9370509.1 alpha/beta fold hydrolase [Rhizobium sp. CSW-27]